MEISKETMKKLMLLIAFAALILAGEAALISLCHVNKRQKTISAGLRFGIFR